MSHELVDNLTENLRSVRVENHVEGNYENSYFDKIIGHIEDLLMEDDFQRTQRHFLEKYWQIFEPVEENKLIYMDIFQEYNKVIEAYIDAGLRKCVPAFSMERFLNELSQKSPELDGQVFEILSTFTDFMAFKEMYLDYRAVKEGKVQDLSVGISITSIKSSNFDSDDPL